MEKFIQLTGVAAPLMEDNINTDALMPTYWIVNTGSDWGNGLFRNWRQQRGDAFVLNQERYRGCQILVAGKNFGCGSSREEAVWALVGFGIRCVIAPSFGDIFYDSSFKNGLLPMILPAPEVAELARELADAPSPQLSVDLAERKLHTPQGRTVEFALDDSRRLPLMQGVDLVGQTLARGAQIAAFQSADKQRRPWIYAV